MSIVVFPFLDESPEVVTRNIGIAAGHPAVTAVWAVGRGDAIAAAADAIAQTAGKRVEVFDQRRLGAFRPGKGDAMNTALARAEAEEVERLHFYDADITNFSEDWISGAESAADSGFQVVRHSFPRAATDAMITWMVTRPMLAITYPGTVLARIRQPLSGEVLLTKPAIMALAGDQALRNRSDWGVDTLLTYSAARHGFDTYEHHVDQGKRHALYGSLAELRTMLIECFDAVASLDPGAPPLAGHHQRQPEGPVPDDLKSTVAYDVEATLPLITSGMTSEEQDLLRSVPGLETGVVSTDRMDGDAWLQVLLRFRDGFRLGDETWEGLLFRLWVARVLHYTETQVTNGYDSAVRHLEETVNGYEAAATADGLTRHLPSSR